MLSVGDVVEFDIRQDREGEKQHYKHFRGIVTDLQQMDIFGAKCCFGFARCENESKEIAFCDGNITKIEKQ